MKNRFTKTQKPCTKPTAKAAPTVTLADVEAYLARQSKAYLLELLMDQVKEDDRLRERLLFKAARTAAKGLDLAVYRQAIFNAVVPDKYVSYREMWDYTSGIDEAVDSVEDLLAELVRIFLWEKDAEAAWREAQVRGCANDLWLELAAAHEKGYSEEALLIYQRQIEPLVNQKNNQTYEQAAKYVCKVHELIWRLGRETDFATYLAHLRKAHKPKRNFMTLLDKEGAYQ